MSSKRVQPFFYQVEPPEIEWSWSPGDPSVCVLMLSYIESGMVGACALIVAMLAAEKHWIKAPEADDSTPSNNHGVLQP